MDARTIEPSIGSARRWRAPLIAFGVLLASIVCIVFFSDQFDRPLSSLVNRAADLSGLVDMCFLLFAGSKAMFSGVILLAAIWYAWFERGSALQQRAELLLGTLVAYAAGVVSRVLQLVLPTHPRPLHDPLLTFNPPTGVDPHTLNHWNSFPSDHAAVFFGLAYAVYRVDRRIGALSFAFAALLCFARVYLGYHYPTDVIGGGALGVFCVAVCMQSPLRRLAEQVTLYANRRPGIFYMLAFVVSYGIATLFNDVRDVAEGALQYLRHHA